MLAAPTPPDQAHAAYQPRANQAPASLVHAHARARTHANAPVRIDPHPKVEGDPKEGGLWWGGAITERERGVGAKVSMLAFGGEVPSQREMSGREGQHVGLWWGGARIVRAKSKIRGLRAVCCVCVCVWGICDA